MVAGYSRMVVSYKYIKAVVQLYKCVVIIICLSSRIWVEKGETDNDLALLLRGKLEKKPLDTLI